MKVIVIDNSPLSKTGDEPSLTVYPDSCIFMNNDPFFMPDPGAKVVVRAGIVLKIEKLGKHVAPEFAPRYFSSAGLAIDFVQRDLEESLKSRGLGTGPALYFDRSLAISSEFVPKEAILSPYLALTFKINSAELSLGLNSSRFTIDDMLSTASRSFTLKIGDLLLVPLLSLDKGVKQGDIIDGIINGELLLRCHVR